MNNTTDQVNEQSINEIEKLQLQNQNLLRELEDIKHENENLILELEGLKHEYSENTVIQSMNDMKERYNELIRTTVSIYKYRELETKYFKLYRCIYSMLSLIHHVQKLINDIDSKLLYDRQNTLNRTKNDLLTMQDIIEDVIEESV